jgi:putative two-component system response regulator
MTEPRIAARVLVVEDDRAIANVLARYLATEGYEVDVVRDWAAARVAISGQPPDVILLDVTLPGMSGFEICRQLKRDPSTRLTPVVIVTGLDERELRIEALDAGADDFLGKPLDLQELRSRVRSLVRMKRYTDDLESAASILLSLAVLIEARDGSTEGHCHRMANYATALGRKLALQENDLQALHRGGFLHDLGMLAIPEHVLRKAGRLDPEEYEQVKSHTIVGDSLCATMRSLQSVRPIIRSHQERLDGSGYPDGLRGDAIPLVAQIIGIVDVYDAITTHRPYHRAQSIQQALEELREQVRSGWRAPELVDAFVAIVESGALERYRPESQSAPDKQ